MSRPDCFHMPGPDNIGVIIYTNTQLPGKKILTCAIYPVTILIHKMVKEKSVEI